ncbi:MAG: hypothetical protein ACJ72O_08395 [Marmoricola sp.]
MGVLDRVWAGLSSADRIVLLGHDRPELSVADKVRLAALARNIKRTSRQLDENWHARRPRTTA